MSQPFLKSLPQQSGFVLMLELFNTIRVNQRSNTISRMFDRGICMKELSIFISKSGPFNSATLFPINPLLLKKFA
jgi:hypothetical protein